MDEAAPAPTGLESTEPTGPGDDGVAALAAAGEVDIEVDQLAATVYGTIVSGSVMAVSAGQSTVGKTTLAVIVTLLVYWLAESYAHLVAIRVVGVSPARRAHARHRLASSWRLVTASFVPLAAMLLAALAGADNRDAVLVGLLCTTVLLGVVGWIAARRSGLHGLAVVASTLASGMIGLTLIALKFALH